MRKYISVLLTLSFILSLATSGSTSGISAQTLTLKQLRPQARSKPPKLSPDLQELLTQDDEEEAAWRQGKTLAEVRQERLTRQQARQNKTPREAPLRTLIKGIALPSPAVKAEEKQSFIVQLDGTTPEVVMQEKLALRGGRISQKLSSTGLVVIEAPRTTIRQIAAEGSIAYVSPDRLIGATTFGHVVQVTGRSVLSSRSDNDDDDDNDDGDDDGGNDIEGTNMNVAVLDSGIWGRHHSLVDRLLTSVDFTGEGITKSDPYGHGTHIASLAVGKPHVAKGAYEGLAPGAKVANLRVLDAQGRGSVSGALKAINWLLTNATKYKIRVANLSFGAPAVDSYKNDPLCLAVRRLVNAGIVVVVAAGNDGKDRNGRKIYGRIHAPGNEPSAITVGAANDMGTAIRSDDGVASYSSRGPTRSSYTDAQGIRRYDNLIKPDLVATGNKLIAASAEQNYLIRTYPHLNARVAPAANHNQMFLSGTSVATPIVAGAAALVLQANPTLTPNLVKAVLMYTAQPLKGYNMLEQGAGLLNVAGAVQLAKLIRTDLTSTTLRGTALLKSALPRPQANVISGEMCYWEQVVIAGPTFFYGSALMSCYQGIYRNGLLLGDGIVMADGIILSNKTLMADGVQIAEGPVTANGVISADSPLLAKGIVLADGSLLADGFPLGDGIILGDGSILGDGTLLGDAIRSLSVQVNGDDTPSMSVIKDS
jgi:subtilisin family serine protease